MTTDLKPWFFNEPQDNHTFLDNATEVQTASGDYVQIAASNPDYKWEWFYVDVQGPLWTNIPLAQTFHLNLVTTKDIFGGNGEKLFGLKVTEVSTGFFYTVKIPTIVNLSDWQDGGYSSFPMPYPGNLSFGAWMTNVVTQHNYGPYRKAQYLAGGKTGDLDMNGVVDTSDILILGAGFGG